MNEESLAFLQEMEETPSVTGFEQPVARIIRKRMKSIADQITTDVHGNVTAILNPKGSPKVMLAGHMDQIGLMVRHIDDQGYIYFGAVGGVDATVLPGSRLTIHNKRGPIEGVIGRKPIHLMKEDERNKAKIDMNELWIDIGVKSKEEAMRNVAIADPITYRLGMTRLGDDLITSPGLDNKVGAFVVMEALRLAKKRRLKCALFAVATVAEEIGLRGARTSCYGIDPLVGIAVDVTHATDNPGADKKQAGDIALGKGAVIDLGANINPVVGELFVKTAQEEKIAHQLCAAPGATGTDANAIQISRSGVATGLISIPNRYMHTQVEVCSLSDLESCASLIAATVSRIKADTNFIPM